MRCPASVLTTVLALSITSGGKSYPLFERGKATTQSGDFEYIQLSSAFKHEKGDKTPRITTLESVQVLIAWGKAAELLKPYVEANAFQSFYMGKDGSPVPNMRINLASPARVGQTDGAVLSALTAMQNQNAIIAQRGEFRAQLTQAMDEFKLGIITKEEYLAVKALVDAGLAALNAPPATTTVTPPTTPTETVSASNPFPEE